MKLIKGSKHDNVVELIPLSVLYTEAITFLNKTIDNYKKNPHKSFKNDNSTKEKLIDFFQKINTKIATLAEKDKLSKDIIQLNNEFIKLYNQYNQLYEHTKNNKPIKIKIANNHAQHLEDLL